MSHGGSVKNTLCACAIIEAGTCTLTPTYEVVMAIVGAAYYPGVTRAHAHGVSSSRRRYRQ